MYCGEHDGRETGGEREGDGREERGHEGNGWEEPAVRSSLGLPKTEATWRGCRFVAKKREPHPTPKRVKRWGGKEKRGEVVLKNLNSNF